MPAPPNSSWSKHYLEREGLLPESLPKSLSSPATLATPASEAIVRHELRSGMGYNLMRYPRTLECFVNACQFVENPCCGEPMF